MSLEFCMPPSPTQLLAVFFCVIELKINCFLSPLFSPKRIFCFSFYLGGFFLKEEAVELGRCCVEAIKQSSFLFLLFFLRLSFLYISTPPSSSIYKIQAMDRRGWKIAGHEEDFREEDVWGFTRNNKGRAKPVRKDQPTSNPRMIPLAAQNNNFQSHQAQHQHSAPVNIPDWRKMLKWNNHGYLGNNAAAFVDDGWDEKEEEMLPPHEFISRREALNNQIVSSSMCEGIGGTLKGREVSRVRNSILSRTGFLEE